MSEMVTALEANPYEPVVIQDSPIHKSLICLARYSPFAFPELTYLIKHNDLDSLAYVIADMSLSTRALIQTTQAVDVIWGGDKINSLPEVTKVGVNYRVAPQNSVLEIQHKVLKSVEHIIHKFGLDVHAYEGDTEFHRYLDSVGEAHLLQPPRVINYGDTLTVEADKKFEGAGASPQNTEAWRIFAGTIESTFGVPGRRVVPTGVIMTGNTDSKHYLGLSENIYRWNPHPATDIENFHAVDERLRVAAHMDVVKFYYNLVRNFDGPGASHLSENQQEL